MAANIQGDTIHHWAAINFSGSQTEINAVFIRCQNLRWILIDEISMVSAELLFALASRTTDAARPIGTYKRRPDKSPRPFGGFNVVLFGDWWQLRPVQSTPLFEQPSKMQQGAAFEGGQLLWGRTRDAVRRVWELTEPMRCPQRWFQLFLAECREGRLTRENYFYIHGMPTQHVGSMVPGDAGPACGSAACQELQRETWPKMFAQGSSWAEMRALECAVCQEERAKRDRVVKSMEDPRFSMPPFAEAPYIHPHNAPKYDALVTRAIAFAKQHRLCINWVAALDQPLHRDDQALSTEALTKKRQRWLSWHDQDTAGIMGLLPLVRGLPVRLTSSVNRSLKLFKQRRGTVIGWTLHPDEASIAEGGERCLSHQPLCIYLRFDDAAWQVGDLEPGVFPLFPKSSVWFVDKQQKKPQVKVKRTGFEMVPDFSGTGHMYQDGSLKPLTCFAGVTFYNWRAYIKYKYQ